MTAIEFENISKQYRLGLVSTGTLRHDINRWWQTSVLHKEDPYLKIGETNDRSVKGTSEYVWALRDINFKVEQGDVVGIIGKNGAGKSTLLKLLSKVTGPTTGTIRARGRIGSLLEVGTGFHQEMTGRENIYLNGAILGMSHQEISRKLDEIVDFSGCERYIDTPVKRYSSGMMVRLGFAVAAHLDPEILVVDEVLAVGDAEFQKKAIGKMKDVSQGEGRTVLFVSHNMDSVVTLCKSGILLQNGSIVYSGDAKSAVAEYLSGRNSGAHYLNDFSESGLFTSDVHFSGGDENRRGLFDFNESVHLNLSIRNKKGEYFERNTVVSVCIQTQTKKMVSVTELNLSELYGHDLITYDLEYPSGLLMPGNYVVQIDIHLPNVNYFDQQETVAFKILDHGSEFLKYGGNDNGSVYLRPVISSSCN